MTILYRVSIGPSVSTAVADNARASREMNHVDGQVTRVSALTFTGTPLHAAQLHAWGSYLPLLGCMQHVAGSTYRNLAFVVTVTSDDGLDACQDKIDWGT